MNVSNEIEKKVAEVPRRKPATIREQIEGADFRAAIAQVLPRHLTPDRFVRVTVLALTRTPLLAECDRASLFGALMRLSQLGLEPDGYRAHLIPFRNRKRNCVECQLIVDYKGIAELVMRSGVVSFLHADVICENDEFVCDRGEITRHRINLKEDRGVIYGVYCRVKFKDGSEQAEVMSKSDVERIRQRSKTPNEGPWVTDWAEMAKKTVFRRLSKWLPLSPEIREAASEDGEALEERRIENARPIFETPAPAFRPDSFLGNLPTSDAAEGLEEVAPPKTPEEAERIIIKAGPSLRPDSTAAGTAESKKLRPDTPHYELASLVLDLDYTYDDLRQCAEINHWPCDLGAFNGFEELPNKDVAFLLKNKAGLAMALKTFKAK